MADVKATVELDEGPLQEGSKLADWIAWALMRADAIDPLGQRRRKGVESASGDESQRPNQPR